MESLSLLFLLDIEKTPTLVGAVTAILLAFSVVAGAALERLFNDQPLVKEENYQHPRDEVFYWLVLTIVITVAIRFLVGSYVHLHMTYTTSAILWPPGPLHVRLWSFSLFLRDLFFLFAFGAFLVRIVLSKTCERFMWWIMLFTAADIIWCVCELITHRSQPLAWGWFEIGIFQFLVAIIGWRLLEPKKASIRNLKVFVFLAIIFAVIFCVDLWQILVGSGWSVFDVSPC
jgi:hypothetical protein